jgi:hypothetical protein
MYDFNVTVKADFLYEIIGAKQVRHHTDHDGAKQVRHHTDYDGALMSTSEVKVRCVNWEEVIKWIRANRDVTIKQVVEMKDMTVAAQNQSRDNVGYND